MKIVSLNAWAGCVYGQLMKFLAEASGNTDVFCFQEMTFCPSATTPDVEVDPDDDYGRLRTDLFGDISRALPEFTGIAYPALEGSKFEGGALPDGMQVGQAIFVRKGTEVVDSGGMRCFDSDSDIAREKIISITGNCQWVQFNDVLLMNLHGLWQKEGKGDTPDRLRQSEILTSFMLQKDGSQVLVGDFNMLPDSDSFRHLAQNKQDLIGQYDIKTTRSPLYTKGIPFSDYALCSPDVKISVFEVPSVIISDHLPLVFKIN